MNTDRTATATETRDEHAWLRDGSVPLTREDRLAAMFALLALLLSLALGLLVALMPVPAQAAAVDDAKAPSLELAAFKVVPATPGHPEQLVAAGVSACAVSAQPAVGAAGSVEWTLTGSVPSGASGSVVFSVTVQ